ncbi:methyltransferase domain-containing protein [Candidatus Pacearchaeota archaeon]|nr:methyltransferase domain-containing protein [Candidatus Pacearchaeota archaeon]
MKLDLFPGGGKYAGLFEIDFGLESGARILDVGGGHRPYPQSTHVCDMRDADNQRHHRGLSIGDRKFINGKAEEILKQFPDDHFDFCYTNHTLEHIEDLGAALKEISRVSKRGFNAFPASDFEFMTAKSHFGHVNLIRVVGGEIHFVGNRPTNTISNDLGNLFEHRLFINPIFMKIWEGDGIKGLRHIWEGRHYWEGEIKFKEYEGDDALLLFPQLEFFQH